MRLASLYKDNAFTLFRQICIAFHHFVGNCCHYCYITEFFYPFLNISFLKVFIYYIAKLLFPLQEM